MLLSERYRLELHWDSVSRPEDGLMVFKGAYFSGPVLTQAVKLKDNDSIRLDFCSQHSIIVKNIYLADLRWGQVKYENKIIKLEPLVLEYDSNIKGIPNLQDTDYLVIDTEDHEVSKHIYYMVYPAFVVDRNKEEYDYRR